MPRHRQLLSASLFFVLWTRSGIAQPRVLPPEGLKLDAAERKRVIDGAIANLEESYVYPDVAARMAAALRSHEKSGAYDGVISGQAFADLLTVQLRDVSHDKHLRLIYGSLAPPMRMPHDAPHGSAEAERIRCAFEKVEVLAHNIGYVKINGFVPGCESTVAAAMLTVDNVTAVIFDLRDNHGGDPHTVALIASYLFSRPTHLNDMYDRKGQLMEESWTLHDIPPSQLARKPIYVLTSATTFSGGEEFCYDLKSLKRATLVGETTGGGAHPVRPQQIDQYFTIAVPFARPVNPVSKKDWEGTGVEPDVKVKASDALITAQKLALEQLAKN